MRYFIYVLVMTLGIHSSVYAASAEEAVDENRGAVKAHIDSIKRTVFKCNETRDLPGITRAFFDYITLAGTVAPEDDVLLTIAGMGTINSGRLADGLKLMEEFLEMRKEGPSLDKDSALILAQTATAYIMLDNETGTTDNHLRAIELFVNYFNLIGGPQNTPAGSYETLLTTGNLYEYYGDPDTGLNFYEQYFRLIDGIGNTLIENAGALKDFGDLLCRTGNHVKAVRMYQQYLITTNTLEAPAPEDMYMKGFIAKVEGMQQASHSWLARHSGKKVDLYQRKLRDRKQSPLAPRSDRKPSQALVPSKDDHDVENAGGYGGAR